MGDSPQYAASSLEGDTGAHTPHPCLSLFLTIPSMGVGYFPTLDAEFRILVQEVLKIGPKCAAELHSKIQDRWGAGLRRSRDVDGVF